MSLEEIDICLIRHGITVGNTKGCYIGVTDEPLLQKEITKKYPKAQRVVSSPLKRCMATARLIYPENKIEIIHDFRETDFGKFEGKNYEELKNNPDYQKWIDSGGTLPFPDGESRKNFEKRTVAAFIELVKSSFETEKSSVAAIVHGGTIMAVLSNICGGNFYDYHIKNLEGYSFTIDKTDYSCRNLRRI